MRQSPKHFGAQPGRSSTYALSLYHRSVILIRELLQVTQSPSQGWTPEALAASLRVAALVLVLPALVFVALAVVVERRSGARWLAALWAGTMCVLVAYSTIGFRHISGRRAEMLANMGGLRPLYIVEALIYGLPFALCALAIWLVGARRRRSAWLQVVVGFLTWLVSVPLAILLSAYTERFWTA